MGQIPSARYLTKRLLGDEENIVIEAKVKQGFNTDGKSGLGGPGDDRERSCEIICRNKISLDVRATLKSGKGVA